MNKLNEVPLVNLSWRGVGGLRLLASQQARIERKAVLKIRVYLVNRFNPPYGKVALQRKINLLLLWKSYRGAELSL